MLEPLETGVRFLGQEDPLDEGMATHSSIIAWRIPRTEEPSRLQFIGSQRVRHDCSDQGQGEPGGLPSMESHRVGHD